MGDDNVTGDLAIEYKPVYQAEDEEFYYPLIDRASRANANMDLNHHEIHEGDHFFVAEYITLGNAAVGDFILEIGDKDIHFVFAAWSDIAGFIVQTYEAITASADGTVIPFLNNCRPLKNKTTFGVLRYNPVTVGSIVGLIRLRNTKVGAGVTPSSRVAGSVQRSDEVVLSKNTKYLLRITNLSTSNNDINIAMSGYCKNIITEW